MKKKILVIEDGVKHRQDAQIFFKSQPYVKVIYASTYSDASKVMFGRDKEGQRIKGDIDGVISDIYFPLTLDAQWSQPEPIGVRVAIELSKLGVPFVLNTAGYHHGRKYEWIHQLALEQGWKIVDMGYKIIKSARCEQEAYELEIDSKDWKCAYTSLEERIK